MEIAGFHDRLREVVGERSYRAVGELTTHNPETVRRYLSGQAPSVEFIAALCHRLDVHADWLLTGRGPMRASQATSAALQSAKPEELLTAMAGSVEHMSIRVDRIDTFVQTLETRLRAHLAHAIDEMKEMIDGHQAQSRPTEQGAGAAPARARAKGVADAVAKRSRPDAGGTPPAGGA